MTLRTLNYGNYGIFLIMGNAGFCPSTVGTIRGHYYQLLRLRPLGGGGALILHLALGDFGLPSHSGFLFLLRKFNLSYHNGAL